MTKDKTHHIFAEISNDAPDRIQLMRTIKAEHGFYGTIELKPEDLRKFKDNFDLNKRRTDLAVDYSHMSHLEAAGWIKNVELENNDNELWIEVEWTPQAKAKILDKEYRYISADFSMKYVDDETGEMLGQVLHGAGLTNRPFIRGMKAILSELDSVELSEDQISKIRDIALGNKSTTLNEDYKMTLKELKAAIKELSTEDREQLMKDLGVKTSEPSKADDKQLSEAVDRAEKLAKENKELAEKIALSEKERKFDVMLSEGKAVEAQREAYLAGDMDKFVSLSQELNTEEKGTAAEDNGKDEPKTAEQAAAKLTEIAEKIEKEQGLTFDEALSQAVRENEKLYELSEKAA